MRRYLSTAGMALLAVFAFSALAASGASAHNWLIEGKELAAGVKEGTTSKAKPGTVFTLEGEVLGFKTKITCETLSSEGGEITGGGTDHAKALLYSKCKVIEPSSCTVKEPIKTKELNTELKEVEATLVDEFKPVGSTVFVELELEGASCFVRGKFPVEGTDNGKVIKAETVEKELVFPGPGSKLTFAGKTATLTGTSLTTLTTKKVWSAV